MAFKVIEWPIKGSGKWWIVRGHGPDADPPYTPIAQHRTRAIAQSVLDDMASASLEELEAASRLSTRRSA